MLILTRRVGETLLIYDGDKKIGEITVKFIRGQQASLAIDAPREIVFVRKELVTPGREG